MAAPSAPTLISITTEALLKAKTFNSINLSRAQDEWMEEIKNDIWMLVKKSRYLQTSNIFVITNGEGLISYPSDFSSDLSLAKMDCTHFGVCQAGGSVTIAKLASDEDMSESYSIGREIIVYLTTDKTSTYSGFITAFDESTKIATFAPAITISAGTTYSYMIIDSYEPIEGPKHIIRLDELYNYANRGIPRSFYPIGSNDYGSFYLYPVPYRTSSVPWAIRQRYYANLMTLDLSGTLIATLYLRWRSLFVQGVFANALLDIDDNRANIEFQKYRAMLQVFIAREQYGMDLSDMQIIVKV